MLLKNILVQEINLAIKIISKYKQSHKAKHLKKCF